MEYIEYQLYNNIKIAISTFSNNIHEKYLDSDWLREAILSKYSVQKNHYSAQKEKKYQTKNLCLLKTGIELLCRASGWVNNLFRMCLMHGSEHKFASV
jgi:hypothetical protein